MFRHRGKTRTLHHNLRIASLLSCVAGMVNVIGFLTVARLTTNVTGHFAFFVDEIFRLNFWRGFIYFSYILAFLLGAFVSNMLIEIISRKRDRNVFVLPVLIEGLILFAMAFVGRNLIDEHPDWIALSLLFAMGLQNSLVTTISKAVVRTTHLTGLFTDLGIELSQLFFYKEQKQRRKLLASIRLRLTIISFFFLGGIAGGVSFSYFGLHALYFASLLLVTGLVYDNAKFRIKLLHRKLKKSQHPL